MAERSDVLRLLEALDALNALNVLGALDADECFRFGASELVNIGASGSSGASDFNGASEPYMLGFVDTNGVGIGFGGNGGANDVGVGFDGNGGTNSFGVGFAENRNAGRRSCCIGFG